jgi:hypothetical protein
VVHCESQALADAIASGVNRARQDEIPLRFRCDWRVGGGPDGYFLTDEHGSATAADTVEALRDILSGRMADLAIGGFPDHGRLLAALGRHEGRSLLLVGGPNSGKTTLALALLLAGTEMTGDHLALVGGGQAVAYPQRFGYWETTRALLPCLPDHKLPPIYLDGRLRQHRVLIDPLDLGQPWRVRPDPIGWIFCLDSNFSGRSSLRRCSPADALHYILPHCSVPPAGGALWTARFYALLDRIEPAILTLGTLDTAVGWIQRVLADRVFAETLTA